MSRKGKETALSDSSSLSHSPLFISNETQVKFASLASKKNIYYRIVNKKSKYDAHSLNVIECFDYQGLKTFLGIELSVYPYFIKEFYANLHHPIDDLTGDFDLDTLATRVNNTDLTLTK